MTAWREFGISEAHGDLYQLILASPGVDVEQLVARVAHAHADVVVYVTDLCDKGLVQESAGGFVAVPPDQAVEALIAKAQHDIERRQHAIQEVRQSLPALVDAYLEGHASAQDDAPFEELSEPGAVRSRIFRLAADAQASAWSMIPGEAFSPEATLASWRVDEELLDRGVSVEYIVSLESCMSPHWRAYLDGITAAGAQVRVHAAPPMLAVLFDESVALLPRSEHRGAMVLKGADVSAPLAQLFRQTWGDATRYDDAAGAEGELSPRHQRVLTLLAAGLTDDMIGRRMGLSSRTVRRLVAEVCTTLQAHSRFEAGVEAMRRGLLPVKARQGRPTAD